MFVSWLKSFSPKAQPLMTRPSYWREMQTGMTFAVAISMTEGSVIGILARRAFDIGPYCFALIMASPMLSHFTSFFWSRLARGKSKVAAVVVVKLLMLLCVGAIAFLPTNHMGGYILTVLVLLARACLAGVTTLQSTVKRQNYRRNVRAQITGKVMLVVSIILAMAPAICYNVIDRDLSLFRYVYAGAACFALLGVWFYSKIRIRGERGLLKYETMPSSKPTPQGSPAPLYEYNPDDNKSTFWRVLREDANYRSYQFNQFFLGAGNIMSMTLSIFLIEQMTRSLKNSYTWSMIIGTTLPFIFSSLTVQVWAKYLDKTHIAKFRVFHSMVFATAILLVFIADWYALLWLLAVAQIIRGVAGGGAMLAWQLGHNDFADRRQVMTYIGIHATLTGVRGATAPFMGILLYHGWGDSTIHWLPNFQGIGPYTFLIALAMQGVAMSGFARLYRRMHPHTA